MGKEITVHGYFMDLSSKDEKDLSNVAWYLEDEKMFRVNSGYSRTKPTFKAKLVDVEKIEYPPCTHLTVKSLSPGNYTCLGCDKNVKPTGWTET